MLELTTRWFNLEFKQRAYAWLIGICTVLSPMCTASPSFGPPVVVGNTTVFIHDRTRGYDEAAGVTSGIRTLITEIWYPADPQLADSAHRRATYGDYVFGNRAVHRLMMTRTTFFHLTPETAREDVSKAQIGAAIEALFYSERGSFVDAPLAKSESPFPIIVMSHGDAGSRYNLQSLSEHLAANGYVVIAPEHTGNAPFSMSGEDPALNDDLEFRIAMDDVLASFNEFGTYGAPENFGQSYTPLSSNLSGTAAIEALDRSLLQRIADLRATLRELEAMNEHGFFAASLDLERIGVIGRSFGASTVLSAMSLERRFRAGVAVAPPSMPDPRPALPPEMLVPPERESAILNAVGAYGPSNFTRPTMLLASAEDRLIIAIETASAEASGSTLPSPRNRFPTLRTAFEGAKAPVVWAMLENANHATFGVSGDYWWPELKVRALPRVFDPKRDYTLIAPALAHQMQRDKVLAFFDLFVAEKEDARPRLLSETYAKDGLSLEHRNF